VARGGSPCGDDAPTAQPVSVTLDGWQIDAEASIETSRHPQVTAALRAVMHVALHPDG
jgi:hypothetical protein